MRKKRTCAVLLVLIMILTACGAKNIEEKIQPVDDNAVTESHVLETEYVVPDIPGLDRNDFSVEEFEESQKEINLEESELEDPESKEEIPVTTEMLVSEEDNSQESDVIDKSETEYQRYMGMSGSEQKAFIESFDSMEAFFEWLDNARVYDETINGSVVIEGDTIDLSKIS